MILTQQVWGGEGSIFRDDDGSTYFVYTGAGHTNGNETIDKLSSDLKSVVSRKWQSTIAKREGNVILKANGRYYLIHSGMKGWALVNTIIEPLQIW